jgi:hypothetical protein
MREKERLKTASLSLPSNLVTSLYYRKIRRSSSHNLTYYLIYSQGAWEEGGLLHSRLYKPSRYRNTMHKAGDSYFAKERTGQLSAERSADHVQTPFLTLHINLMNVTPRLHAHIVLRYAEPCKFAWEDLHRWRPRGPLRYECFAYAEREWLRRTSGGDSSGDNLRPI